jgi:hypothetical protein
MELFSRLVGDQAGNVAEGVQNVFDHQDVFFGGIDKDSSVINIEPSS